MLLVQLVAVMAAEVKIVCERATLTDQWHNMLNIAMHTGPEGSQQTSMRRHVLAQILGWQRRPFYYGQVHPPGQPPRVSGSHSQPGHIRMARQAADR